MQTHRQSRICSVAPGRADVQVCISPKTRFRYEGNFLALGHSALVHDEFIIHFDDNVPRALSRRLDDKIARDCYAGRVFGLVYGAFPIPDGYCEVLVDGSTHYYLSAFGKSGDLLSGHPQAALGIISYFCQDVT